MFAAIISALFFLAFILLLLVSLSAPIIKSIFLFRLMVIVESSLMNTGASGSVYFGVWGYCISAIDVSIAGVDRDAAARCSKTQLGYTFDSTVAKALHANDLQSLISRASTAALVLHPVVAGLTFLAFLISLLILRRGANGTRLPSLVTLGVGLIAAVLTTVVFLIDVIFVAVIRHKVKDRSDGDLILTWGNAVWMALGAAVMLWLAVVGVCACSGRHRTQKANRF